MEEELGQEYTSQTIKSELVLDAGTYEVVECIETMLLDGEEKTVCVISVEYGTPESLACRALRAAFERDSENMMTLTFLIDFGTEREMIRKFSVPVNMEASFMFGSVPFVYFNDPDCETLSHWDRMSDRSIYIFTYPDDELSEKFQNLMSEALKEMQTAEPETVHFE